MASASTSKEIFINPTSKNRCYKTLKESKDEIGIANTTHTSAELANGQVQCEYGHGYVSGDKVQLKICD